MPKESYTDVTPGTEKYRILQMLMRSQGVSASCIPGSCYSHCLGALIDTFRDMNGYDIRGFAPLNLTKKTRRSVGRPKLIYRCIGRYHWDGGYTDYTKELQDSL